MAANHAPTTIPGQAGYDWAAQNGITDPGDCSGSSQSFFEGCMAWAEEQFSYGSGEGEDSYDDEDCEDDCEE